MNEQTEKAVKEIGLMIYGFKFLDPTGSTYYAGKPFTYVLPGPAERYSAWTEAPNPASPDGRACGPGRLHIMKFLNVCYAPTNWWPWFAIGEQIVGEDEGKAGVHRVQLRRIYPKVLWRALRPPFNWGKGADLWRANLQGANLQEADLWGHNTKDLEERGAIL